VNTDGALGKGALPSEEPSADGGMETRYQERGEVAVDWMNRRGTGTGSGSHQLQK